MRTCGPPTVRRVLAALIASTVTFTAVGCSLIEDDDGTATPTTVVAPKPVALAQLEAILPAPEAIGPGYVVVPTEPSGETSSGPDIDGAIETEMRKECPEAAEIMMEEDGSASPEAVAREYDGPNGEHFGVLFEADDEITDRAAFEATIAAIELCGTLNITVPSGVVLNITMDAELDDSLGDWGGIFRLQMSQLHPTFPAPVTIWIEFHTFLVGSVGVTVSAGDGLNKSNLMVHQRNTTQQDAIATNLAFMVAALQMEAPADPVAGPEPAAVTQPPPTP